MISPLGSYTNAVPTPSPTTRRRPDAPRRSCSVFTNTTAGSALAARSAKLCGARAPGNGAGKGDTVGSAVAVTGNAPEGSGTGPVLTPAGRRLQPANETRARTLLASAAARKRRPRFTCAFARLPRSGAGGRRVPASAFALRPPSGSRGSSLESAPKDRSFGGPSANRLLHSFR